MDENIMLIKDLYTKNIFKKKKNKQCDTLYIDNSHIKYNIEDIPKNIKRIVFKNFSEIIRKIEIPSNVEDIFICDLYTFKRNSHLHGVTIDYKGYMFKSAITNTNANIQQINILDNREVHTIKCDDIIEKLIMYENFATGNMEIILFSPKKQAKYAFGPNKGNINKKKNLIINDCGTLNLKDIYDYDIIQKKKSNEKIKIENLVIPTSIITKDIKTNFNKSFVHIKNIKIVDDNDMKLIPTSNNIEVNGEIELIQRKDKIIIVCYNNSSFDKLISVDKDSNINIIDDKFLLEHFPNYKSASLYYNKNKCNLIINFNTDDKCAVINDEGKIYRLNGIFKSFLINEEEYYDSTLKGILENNISKSSFDLDKLLKKYEEYKKYLRNLKDMGLSTKVLYNSLYKENADFDNIKMLIKEHKVNEENAKTIDDFGKLLIKK